MFFWNQEIVAEINVNQKFEKSVDNVNIHVDLGHKPDVSTNQEPIATFRLEVTAPASKLMALRKFIDDNGICYKKI